MKQEEPFALFLTWTCYGTWLPGDERGYVSNTLHPKLAYDPKVNTPGTPYTRDDAYSRQHARNLQKGPTTWLSAPQAACASESFVKACEKRSWRILRGSVMANHVHLVITACPGNGPDVRRILKGNSQAALSEAFSQHRRWWTAGGSDRYLHGATAIETVIRYVQNQKGILADIVDMRLVNQSERRG